MRVRIPLESLLACSSGTEPWVNTLSIKRQVPMQVLVVAILSPFENKDQHVAVSAFRGVEPIVDPARTNERSWKRIRSNEQWTAACRVEPLNTAVFVAIF